MHDRRGCAPAVRCVRRSSSGHGTHRARARSVQRAVGPTDGSWRRGRVARSLRDGLWHDRRRGRRRRRRRVLLRRPLPTGTATGRSAPHAVACWHRRDAPRPRPAATRSPRSGRRRARGLRPDRRHGHRDGVDAGPPRRRCGRGRAARRTRDAGRRRAFAGTMRSYQALCNHPQSTVDTFVTLGSPLASPMIFARLDPRGGRRRRRVAGIGATVGERACRGRQGGRGAARERSVRVWRRCSSTTGTGRTTPSRTSTRRRPVPPSPRRSPPADAQRRDRSAAGARRGQVAEDLGVLQLVPAGFSVRCTSDHRRCAMEEEVDVAGPPRRVVPAPDHVPRDAVRRRPGSVGDRRLRGGRSPAGEPLRDPAASACEVRVSRCFGVALGHRRRALVVESVEYFPTYRPLLDLPFAARIERSAVTGGAGRRSWPSARSTPVAPALDHLGRRSFDQLFPLGDPLDYEPAPEASVGAIARRTGEDPWAVAYDLLLGSRRTRVPAVPAAQLRRRLLRRCARHDGGPDDGAGPGRRRCPLRRHLRRAA